ncbi:MAG TPA: XdhC family protein [Pyrinomonadaceae bacterium]|nr:XdhC family protein [Pyrinomonadaceae bacterium]
MAREIELWQFIAHRLRSGERVVLLVVAESHGSSPGRAGYKMAVAADGELVGSIGGGVMEVNLVEQAKASLADPQRTSSTHLIEQEHRKNSEHPSGMICSGRQTVVLKILTSDDLDTLDKISERITLREPAVFDISDLKFEIADRIDEAPVGFVRTDTGFSYRESLGQKDHIYIIGGGHCALALSEMMARLDFRVSIFDDRPELNTLEKNEFADSITTVESYEEIAVSIAAEIISVKNA